ncbi:MAG: histidine kinase [Ancrocorticia sp.]
MKSSRTRKARPQLSAMEQMRRYVLLPLYTTFAAIGIMMLYVLFVVTPVSVWSAVYGVSFTAHVVVTVAVLRGIALQEVDSRPLPRWSLPGLAASTLAACGAGFLVTFLSEKYLDFPFGPVVLPLILTGWTLAPRLNWQWTVAVSSVIGLAMVGFAAMLGEDIFEDPGFAVTSLWLPTFGILMVMMLTIRWSITVTASVRDQSQMDAMRADLAVAEERLRIARDMHDILGRTLTAVALKSDLAAALAMAGQSEKAAAESKAVHQLADDALRELRGVLAGYRRADLSTELAGAKGLLDSAGVVTRLIGDARDVPQHASEAFSWVLREAATNIVRHSEATRCTIRLDVRAGESVLSVTNDGVREIRPHRFGFVGTDGGSASAGSGAGSFGLNDDGARDLTHSAGFGTNSTGSGFNGGASGCADVPGSGLAGLRGRLEALDATLAVERDGDTFVLVARVPQRISSEGE